jgi:hypothetical protein
VSFNSSMMGEHSEIFGVRIMVFNATLNTISDLSKRSVLLVEETGVSGENHRPGFELTTLVVIGTDCTGSCKSNNYTITTTTAHNSHLAGINKKSLKISKR